MTPLVDTLAWQFRMTWSLGHDHWLPPLTDELLFWEQATNVATIRRDVARWRPDWDEDPDPVPPATIAWLTWHIQWWWSEALAAARNQPILGREAVVWSGTADGVRAELTRLADEWTDLVASLTDDALERLIAYPWPEPRPLRWMVAWVNSELMKNTAEIGDVVRLYNARRLEV